MWFATIPYPPYDKMEESDLERAPQFALERGWNKERTLHFQLLLKQNWLGMTTEDFNIYYAVVKQVKKLSSEEFEQAKQDAIEFLTTKNNNQQ